MRSIAVWGLVVALGAAACAKQPALKDASAVGTGSSPSGAPSGSEPADAPRDDGTTDGRTDGPKSAAGSWLGAATEGEMLASGTRDTFVGIWVDVPDARSAKKRPPMEVALVVDTSGSMAGPKIEQARAAAKLLVNSLHDGDIVALDVFSDDARMIVPATRIDMHTRAEVLRAVQGLVPTGSTNMFAGLVLGEGQVAAAPTSHPLRRIVMISDGIANVGPSSPEALAALAERGLGNGVQIVSLGVGADYDERTLDALAVGSSGRFAHIGDASEMVSVLKNELDLLDRTLATGAVLEVTPAAGVELLGSDGNFIERGSSGAVRIPLGALRAGQHREALVRARIVDPASFEGHSRAFTSVRLRFRDVQDNDIERVQEVVTRVSLTGDAAAVERSINSRAKAISAMQGAAMLQFQAAESVKEGKFREADRHLAEAQRQLAAQAQVVTSAPERKRIEAAASKLNATRRAAAASQAAPAPMQRDQAKRMMTDRADPWGR